MLAKFCPPFGAESGHSGEGKQHSPGVVHSVSEFHRRSVGVPGEIAETTDGGEQRGVASVIVLRPALAVGGEGYQDDVRLRFTQSFVPEP